MRVEDQWEELYMYRVLFTMILGNHFNSQIMINPLFCYATD